MPSACDRCGAPTFYHRAYSGESLCRSCFLDSIEDKVRKTIAKHSMFHYGDYIGVAVSGGKDSLSLLEILAKVSAGHSRGIVALTIDEGIEGYRSESLEHAAKMAAKLRIPHQIHSYKELFGFTLDEALRVRKGGLSSCAICGTLRRRAIDIAAQKAGVDVLATAHNLDDVVQTFMINLFNGDVKRIGWIDPRAPSNAGFKVRRVHPLLEIYEKEIALYAFVKGLPLQTIRCPYMDEGIRTSVRAYLNGLEEKHPGIKHTLLSSALELSRAARVGQPRTVKCARCGFPSTSDPCSVCSLLETLSSPTL